MNLPCCMLLLAWSGGTSVLQLPVLGWFSQVRSCCMGIVELLWRFCRGVNSVCRNPVAGHVYQRHSGWAGVGAL